MREDRTVWPDPTAFGLGCGWVGGWEGGGRGGVGGVGRGGGELVHIQDLPLLHTPTIGSYNTDDR